MARIAPAIGRLGNEFADYNEFHNGDDTAHSGYLQRLAVIDVRDYGAACDGVTNDAAAIQAAIDDAVNKGVVLLPPGIYNLGTTGLKINRTGTILQGGGSSSYTGGSSRTILNYTGSAAALTIGSGDGTDGYLDGVVVRDLCINGQDTGHYGIIIGNLTGSPASAQCVLDNVVIEHCTTAGLHLRVAQICSFYNVITRLNGGDGVSFQRVTGGSNTTCNFFGLRTYMNGGRGLYIAGCDHVIFYGLVSELNTLEGVYIDKATGTEIRDVIFDAPFIEKNNYDAVGAAWRGGTGWAQFKITTADATQSSVIVLRNPRFVNAGAGNYHIEALGCNLEIFEHSCLLPTFGAAYMHLPTNVTAGTATNVFVQSGNTPGSDVVIDVTTNVQVNWTETASTAWKYWMKAGGGTTITEVIRHSLSGLTIPNMSWFGPRVLLAGFHIWVDGAGKLRIKGGAPTGDTDGTIVGTQS